MPRTWTSEIALASGGVALSVAAGALGAKLAGAVDGLGFSAAIRRFVAGGISGAVAKTVTAPLEAIKLKLQYAEDDDEGALDCARRIFEREGWWGFYRGNLANVLRYFPTQAFNFAFKDKDQAPVPQGGPQEAPLAGLRRERRRGRHRGRRLAVFGVSTRHRPHATYYLYE